MILTAPGTVASASSAQQVDGAIEPAYNHLPTAWPVFQGSILQSEDNKNHLHVNFARRGVLASSLPHHMRANVLSVLLEPFKVKREHLSATLALLESIKTKVAKMSV